jgi:hypothetical protein
MSILIKKIKKLYIYKQLKKIRKKKKKKKKSWTTTPKSSRGWHMATPKASSHIGVAFGPPPTLRGGALGWPHTVIELEYRVRGGKIERVFFFLNYLKYISNKIHK